METLLKNTDNFLSVRTLDELKAVYEYSIYSYGLINDKFNTLDVKATQTIGLVALVGGILIYYIGSPNIKVTSILIVLFLSVLCFLSANLLCLFVLRIRPHKHPPTIEMVLHWIKRNNPDSLNSRIMSSLAFDFAEAEKSLLNICHLKAKYLFLAQLFEIIGVLFMFGFMGVRLIDRL